MGYGVGLLGLVAIKVLAPGYYASQDIRTPVRIAVVVLVLTQILNVLLVPYLAHAGLALSIGLGALVNAAWLLWGLRKSNTYLPNSGWVRFMLQVAASCTALGTWLFWACGHWDWMAMHDTPWLRVAMMVGVLTLSALIYVTCLVASGVKLYALWRR